MKYIKPLFMTFFTFLTPIIGLLSLLFFFVLLDTMMAIWVSVKKEGWKSFKSIMLRKGIGAKLLFYLGTAMLAYGIDIYIMSGTLFGISHLLSKSITSLWIYVEIKSLDETSVKYGNRSIWVIIKEFIKKITSIKGDISNIVK